jgi:hypothetical protein
VSLRSLTIQCAGLFAVAAMLIPAVAAHAAPLRLAVECQHPLVTGEEAYHLKNVTAAVACPVVLALGHWENDPAHAALHYKELYSCGGPGKHTPILKLRSFEGWRLSLTAAGDFQMSRGTSSFDVGGTDFPLNCT